MKKENPSIKYKIVKCFKRKLKHFKQLDDLFYIQNYKSFENLLREINKIISQTIGNALSK